ncbi:MAG TPA: YjbH domain-containing protein [Candidatus Eisenbacteria bacterium]|jgi:hypothetical protein
MIRLRSSASDPRPRRLPGSRSIIVLLIELSIATGALAAQAASGLADSVATPPVETARDSAGTAGAAEPDSALAGALVREGLENVAADHSNGHVRVALENRKYRHSAIAFGIASRLAESPSILFERRLGLEAAAVYDSGIDSRPSVLYPSDGRFPTPPTAERLASTQRSLELVVRPLLTYELGELFHPVLTEIELMPELRYNPWPGGRLRAAIAIPIQNDFKADSLHPDFGQVRPGPTLLEQYAWAPGTALLSATAGLFGNNRYGLSAGIARPLGHGSFLLDAQVDLTGFIAFPDSGITYSTPSWWTGFAGVTYRPPAFDLAVRARAARFLFGDDGVELEVKRTMGDIDAALYLQGTRWGGSSYTVAGIRVAVPLPPAQRPVGSRFRVLPAERFSITYSEEALPVGRYVGEVASRENYLRQLSPGSLSDNADRYRRARGGAALTRTHPEGSPVSLTGMTGFVNTPWCGTIQDRQLELGYNQIPKRVAYAHREVIRNDVYYAALGILPHLEIGVRWTYFPGQSAWGFLVPDSRLIDSDRMLSARIELLEPKLGRPGLAIGVEDAQGTRRFHSTYAVIGVPVNFYQLQNRISLGYAPTIFTAERHVLDGVFGAIEVRPWRYGAVSLENDTEKWNSMIGVDLGLGFRVRVALLELDRASTDRISIGAGWSHSL